jgi:O-antigen/teichoic acid export membrane protein
VAVPVFTTVRTLANLWTTVTNTLTAPLLPDMVRFHANKEPTKLRLTVEAHWVLVGNVVNASVLLAYPLLPWLYAHWTQGLPLNRLLLALLLCATVLVNIGALISLYLNGINSLRVILGTAVLRCVVTLAVGAFWHGRLGVASFGLGILVSELIVLGVTFAVFRMHLRAHISAPQGFSITPAALGACSVISVLIADASAGIPLAWSLPVGAAGVMTSAIWGWRRLPPEVRLRLAQLAALPRKTAIRAPLPNTE